MSTKELVLKLPMAKFAPYSCPEWADLAPRGENWLNKLSCNVTTWTKRATVTKKTLVYYASIRYQRPFLAHEFAKLVG